nr:FGGY family carbohydrate kinase [Phycisphaerae bacterium]
MPKEIFVGIDLGTTVLKAAAFDAPGGRLLAGCVKPLKIRVGPDGSREQNPSQIDRALGGALRAIRGTLGKAWRSVAGLSLAAQGGSALIADRRTGKALSAMMLWNDARPNRYVAEVAAGKPASYWRRLAWHEGPGAGLAKLRWLQENRPTLIRDNNIYIGAGEHVYHRLTGTWRQDACNATQIGCYDVPNNRLVQAPLDVVGVPLSFVAPLRQGHATHPLARTAARRVGLREGIPVAGPYMDHEAGYLSAAHLARRPLQCSLGTAWVGNFLLSKNARWSSPFQLVIPAPVGNGWLIIQPLLTGNVSWDWALQTLLDADKTRAIARLDAVFGRALLPPEHLTCLPWLARPNPLVKNAFGGGVMLGISPHTDAHDMLRALAAGMCYEFFRIFRQVHRRRRFDAIVLGGGASKGWFFARLFAALFDPIEVYTTRDEDLAGARGAIYPFSPTAAACRAKRVRMPNAQTRRRIAAGLDSYLNTYDRVYGSVAVGGPIELR